jgi:hypothetical protein
VEKGGRLTDGIIEDEDDDEAHSRGESSHGETCIAVIILWMSMARTKTVMNYQKRARKTKRTDRRRLRILKWVAPRVCMCFRMSSDPIYRHVKDTCGLFIAYALHHTKLHSSITILAALVLHPSTTLPLSPSPSLLPHLVSHHSYLSLKPYVAV